MKLAKSISVILWVLNRISVCENLCFNQGIQTSISTVEANMQVLFQPLFQPTTDIFKMCHNRKKTMINKKLKSAHHFENIAPIKIYVLMGIQISVIILSWKSEKKTAMQ